MRATESAPRRPAPLRAQRFDEVWPVMLAGIPPLVWTHYPPGATTLERIAHLEQNADEGTTKRGPR